MPSPSRLRLPQRTAMLLGAAASALLSAARGGVGGGGVLAVNSFSRSGSPAVLGVVAFSSAAPPPARRAKQSPAASSSSSIPDPNHYHLQQQPPKANVLTMPLPELESLVSSWGHPKYRASQIQNWVKSGRATTFTEMANLPKALREQLTQSARMGALDLDVELTSRDGTRKRAYRLWDGQLIESVLMPYDDGRNTACISSQAGCAMGCVFCATGQMGFARQLTPDEIYEQVARFDAELKGKGERLSNVVMMGMGEPLANYRNVMEAVRRMNDELGIGARRITVSTVSVVPSIRKLMEEDLQVRLAVSLHCATEEERSALLPANRRYGGIDELMTAVREYIDTTRRRVTFEWALIEGQNDTPDVARRLGELLRRHGIRKDMAHVNIIPLNPTGGFQGGPSGRRSVERFVRVLEVEFGVSATPRMRRGIDIEAGCGQLKAAVRKREEREAKAAAAVAAAERGVEELPGGEAEGGIDLAGDELRSFVERSSPEEAFGQSPLVGVYEEEEEEDAPDFPIGGEGSKPPSTVEFSIHDAALDLDEEEGEVIHEEFDEKEAARLIALVQTSFLQPSASSSSSTEKEKVAPSNGVATVAAAGTGDGAPPLEDDDELESPVKGETTTITDEEAERKARRRRKKLLKNLRMIDKLRDMESAGKVLNGQQLAKIGKEEQWKAEIESLEHNLQ